MNWRLVTSDEELRDLLQRIQQCDAVALDTEFMRRNTFFPQVALLQLYVESPLGEENVAWLVDPLAIQDLDGLKALLTNPSVVKVLHSASEDLEVFSRWLGVLPQPMFDTQKAAALLGIGFGMGYRALVQQMFDIDLPKGETRSDWLQRPLTESQCDYAAQDVTHLWSIWKELEGLAQEQGKWDWIISDGDNSITQSQASAPYYTRVKSASSLDRRQLGALAAICAWREDTARTRDKPRGWIIDDGICLTLAQADPVTTDELNDLRLPKPVRHRYSETLLEILASNREKQESELPPRLPRPLAAKQRNILKSLKGFGRDLAQQIGVAPEILVQSKDYELLVREAMGEVVNPPAHWMGWRRDIVIEPLREQLSRQLSGENA
jgi:ribonuclease D